MLLEKEGQDDPRSNPFGFILSLRRAVLVPYCSEEASLGGADSWRVAQCSASEYINIRMLSLISMPKLPVSGSSELVLTKCLL